MVGEGVKCIVAGKVGTGAAVVATGATVAPLGGALAAGALCAVGCAGVGARMDRSARRETTVVNVLPAPPLLPPGAKNGMPK